jgi:uncharacterized membrane protein YcaP (DUF421 family)
MWHLAIPAWQLVARSVAIYLALLIGLRLFGKREVGQFTLFDLVLVLLVANAVQPAITGPDSSVLGGLIIIGSLFALNWVIATVRGRSPLVRSLLEGKATIVGRDGAWIPTALKQAGLEVEDCMMALREHGFADISEASLVVLETDGSISVVPGSAPMLRGRRRVRTRRL